jgi:hypothetical protein
MAGQETRDHESVEGDFPAGNAAGVQVAFNPSDFVTIGRHADTSYVVNRRA